MKIKLFAESERISHGEYFMATKDSVEGRDVAILTSVDSLPVQKIKTFLTAQIEKDQSYLLDAGNIEQVKYSQGRIRMALQILEEIEKIENPDLKREI